MRPIRLWFERPACRLIGCTSIFARWWEWPHRIVCTWMTKPLVDPKK